MALRPLIFSKIFEHWFITLPVNTPSGSLHRNVAVPSRTLVLWIALVAASVSGCLQKPDTSKNNAPGHAPAAIAPDHVDAPVHMTLQEFEVRIKNTLHWKELDEVLHDGLRCVDGRNEDPEGIEGVVGGDSGICTAVFDALEEILERPLTQAEMDDIVDHVPGTFYMHTSLHALEGHEGQHDGLLEAIMRDPVLGKYAFTPEAARDLLDEGTGNEEDNERLLTIASDPKYQGCGHNKLAGIEHKAYEVREEESSGVAKAVYKRKWENKEQETIIDPLPHDHDERAVAEVQIEKPLNGNSPVPMLEANADGEQIFVLGSTHISDARIDEIVDYIVQVMPHVDRTKLAASAKELFVRQTEQTATRLAHGLPHLVITVDKEGNVQSTQEGVIK